MALLGALPHPTPRAERYGYIFFALFNLKLNCVWQMNEHDKKSDIKYSELNLKDNAEDESGMHVAIPADQATEPKGAADATFHPGVAVPASPPVTSYLRLIKHFGQQGILHQSFLEVFRNCSFISSRG
jgi:hypothetical protein